MGAAAEGVYLAAFSDSEQECCLFDEARSLKFVLIDVPPHSLVHFTIVSVVNVNYYDDRWCFVHNRICVLTYHVPLLIFMKYH